MRESNKFVSPALFLLVALSFFLPFVSFTCQGTKLAEISGMELVTGTRIENFKMEKLETRQDDSDLDNERNINSEPLAVAAFIFALTGIIVSLIPRYSKILSIISGALGALMLLFLRSSINGDIPGNSDFQILEVSYEWGYYFALIIFITAFVLNFFWMMSRNKIVLRSSINDAGLSDTVYCAKCGTPNNADNIFCSRCGYTLTP